ncbi:MAG: hypothetical protein AAFW75_27155 [Cyanobacteria bacterium J06636_16]
MDVSKIDSDVLSDLKDRGHPESVVVNMTAQEAFRAYCEWHGLHGWAGELMRVLDMLREAEADEQ